LSPSWQPTILQFLVRGRIRFQGSPRFSSPWSMLCAALHGTWAEFRHTDSAERCFVTAELKYCRYDCKNISWVSVAKLG
jgi:hypothetical protein